MIFAESHTAENLRNELLKSLREWDILKKVHCVITDNAFNITAAIRLTGWTHLPCLAHTINLIVQNDLKLIETIQKKGKK
ncbi:hypothetical protein NQ314_014121 [Rhamnusium bicolor]|uniref:DUF659 domain-containing protein n=1 Tax=Rhamnusium bicolor TaxID=1586634 RepID=A0AAV8X3Y1_9CUCU|nr:hypothetical protein NQ314_014121 [Rhamnusium bicolor]